MNEEISETEAARDWKAEIFASWFCYIGSQVCGDSQKFAKASLSVRASVAQAAATMAVAESHHTLLVDINSDSSSPLGELVFRVEILED